MHNIKASLATLFLALLLLLFGYTAAFDSWENWDRYYDKVVGGDGLYVNTAQGNNLVIDNTDIYKTYSANLRADGAKEVQFKSSSTLTTVEGDHILSTTSSITQTYTLPKESSITMSQGHALTGSPDNLATDMSSRMNILDPATGMPIVTFSSNVNDDDVDIIVNKALADMGFTTATMEGSNQYSEYRAYRPVSDKGITCYCGETKNLPVDMTEG